MTKDRFFDIDFHKYLRIALISPKVSLAQPMVNADRMIKLANEAETKDAKLCIFPELALTGYSLDDIFRQDVLIRASQDALNKMLEANKKANAIWVFGLPLFSNDLLFNAAAVISKGIIRGIAVKTFLPQYHEFYEKRQFAPADKAILKDRICGQDVAIGNDLVFDAGEGVKFAIEICEDAWVPCPPSNKLALSGASLIINISASPSLVDKANVRQSLALSASVVKKCAYAMVSAGFGESTTDLSWDGQMMIYELGECLGSKNNIGKNINAEANVLVNDIDIGKILFERRSFTSFADSKGDNCRILSLPPVELQKKNKQASSDMYKSFKADKYGILNNNFLQRTLLRLPFVGIDSSKTERQISDIFNIQSQGLARRIQAIDAKKIVLGLSGGIDSTHALFVSLNALRLMGKPTSMLLPVIMPGLATSKSTHNSALKLSDSLDLKADVIRINHVSKKILQDISHPSADGKKQYDKTFENVQAGVRTDYLFRIAGNLEGMVVGTGDLSELALGWCTFGVGDHMSHYNVNSGIPKTLIIRALSWLAERGNLPHATIAVIHKILRETISPELVPASKDGIQSTEDIIGPYALNDFFLYHTLSSGANPLKLAFLTWQVWGSPQQGMWPDDYDKSLNRYQDQYSLLEITKCLKAFYGRFITSQYKRSTLPNGPKVLSAGSLSPRGDWRAPSDIPPDMWLSELDQGIPDDFAE